MQEIKGEDYIVIYNPETESISFQGELTLGGPSEYQPIKDLLEQVVESETSAVTLDLLKLEFLNSSGISMLSKFMLKVKNEKNIKVTILGSNDVPWQSKSIKNFKRLLPSAELKID